VTREIDCVISTGANVRRQDWEGTFDEVLDLSPRPYADLRPLPQVPAGAVHAVNAADGPSWRTS
jgi:hypothetical protein